MTKRPVHRSIGASRKKKEAGNRNFRWPVQRQNSWEGGPQRPRADPSRSQGCVCCKAFYTSLAVKGLAIRRIRCTSCDQEDREKWKKHAPEEGKSQNTQFPRPLTSPRISRSTYTRASKNNPEDLLPVQNLDKALNSYIWQLACRLSAGKILTVSRAYSSSSPNFKVLPLLRLIINFLDVLQKIREKM